jgi:splicing factor 3A subunit 3
MSVEFDNITKMRENPSDESASRLYPYVIVYVANFSCAPDMVEFTDEEGYGKYLDLHELYIMYINLKGVEVNF